MIVILCNKCDYFPILKKRLRYIKHIVCSIYASEIPPMTSTSTVPRLAPALWVIVYFSLNKCISTLISYAHFLLYISIFALLKWAFSYSIKSIIFLYLELAILFVCASRYQATGPEFDFGMGKVHSIFHFFEVEKNNIKLALKINTEVSALGWLPKRDISCKTPQNPWSRK